MKLASPLQCLVVALLASPIAGMTLKALSARSLAAAGKKTNDGGWPTGSCRWHVPTYTLAGVPLTSPKRGLALTRATFPKDFCTDFDLTLPKKKNGNKYGYEGAIAMMGQFYLVVTHTKKLLSGTGFGLMAIIQSDGKGPYFSTVGIAKPGRRITGTFCYKASTNEPMWMVDNNRVQADYIHNKGKKFPSARDVKLAVLTGSHSKDNVEALKGATLHSLQFRPYCED